MFYGYKLKLLRLRASMSIADLAEKVGASADDIRDWESGRSQPDSGVIALLCDVFDTDEAYFASASVKNVAEFEYVSKKTLFGIPLVHINIGLGKRKATGIVAIGNCAVGLVSIGLLSMGLLSFGVLSLGLLSFAAFSCGIISFGAISAGVLAFGAVSVGYMAFGGVAVGRYAIGGAAFASDLAVGGLAQARISIGGNADADYRIVDGVRAFDVSEAYRHISAELPNFPRWLLRAILYVR